MRRVLLLTASICAASAARGHDMYIMPSTFLPAQGATITAGFHIGDSFPESEAGGRLERLRNPKLIWQNGSAEFGNLRTESNRDLADVAVGGSGHLIAAVSTAPTLIELAPAKFAAYLKDEGLTEVIAWRMQHGESDKPGRERYSKYAKSILLSGAPNGFASHRAGLVIEIIPEADPYALKAGDELPIQVLFRGEPAAGLQIESSRAAGADGKTTVVGHTGPDGRLRVPLTAAGLWRIHTIKMERCAEPGEADWESFWASLTFQARE